MLKHDQAQLLASKIYCLQVKTVESYGKIWKSNDSQGCCFLFFKSVTLKDYLTTFENSVYITCISILSDCKYLP